MVLEIIKAGHPVLKQVAEPVDFVIKKMTPAFRRYGGNYACVRRCRFGGTTG